MESFHVGLPTVVIVVLYLVGVNVLGIWVGRGQKSARDYFLGNRSLPWGAVLASIVATETSALTFLSVPGDAYRTGFTFLQLALGYVVGRTAVAFLLLPGYFAGEFATAYAVLERRFGAATRRFASLLFMLTRSLAAAVRLVVPALPIALLFRVPVWAAILVLAGSTAVYTALGGIRADVWVDLLQAVLYLSGAVLSLVVILGRIPGGFREVLASHARAGVPVPVFDFRFDLSNPYTFWSGILGGAFLSMASHGADQLIVQRLLACRGLREARRALIGSGLAILVQFTLFLSIGVSLWTFFRLSPPAHPFASSDQIFPELIVHHLPDWLSAYLVAGILASAMCSESSALNSLASALTHDILGPLFGKHRLEGRRGLFLGRMLTVFWTGVVALLAIGFARLRPDQPGVQLALGLAGVTAGGLLGGFLIARYVPAARQADALPAIGLSTLFVLALWLGAKGWIPFPLGRAIAWPWYSLIGSLSALGAAQLFSLRHVRERMA